MRKSTLEIFRIGLFLGLGLLSNCSSFGSRFRYVGIVELDKSDRAGVLSAYGTPYTKSTVTKNSFTSDYFEYYEKSRWTEEYRYMVIEFTSEKVNGYYFKSSWSEDSSNFDLEKIRDVVPGKSTIASVESLLGKPFGKIKLPTNLLAAEFYKPALEKGAKVCYRYEYDAIGHREPIRTAVLIQKILIIYFDEKGTVVDMFSKSSGP